MISSRWLIAAAAFLMCGCDRILPQRDAPELPDIGAIRQLYAENSLAATMHYSGNVVELVIQQPPEQLRRGGSLWARVGPYIYLFSPGTREVFEHYRAVAGVRVITQAGGVEIARALLLRDRLNDLTWPRALRLLSDALERGTERPSTLDRLVQFGEANAQFQYNPDYLQPR
ncbi:MAG TPA: hypothetical protein VMN60_04360 [Longimicrobiales bacterium]|nr:hypothetical protein [Longimicrobiales bacterium]